MTRKFFKTVAVVLTAFVLLYLPARPAAAQGAQDQQKPAYTAPEYNAYQAAQAEKDPAAKVKQLDDFVSKFPNSTLLQYIYQLYYQAYLQQKNFPKAIEYADKLAALGDKADVGLRLQAIQTRVQSFSQMQFNPKAPDANDQLTKQRDAALQGVQVLAQFPKPASMPEENFAKQKLLVTTFFNTSAGLASLQMKDYAGAVTSFKAVLANDPNDATGSYYLGVAYLGASPPQALDGFWELARAVDLKIKNPDPGKAKDYLRQSILNYEQPQCDSLLNSQVDELLQLAANAPQRPATYTIPAAADLQKIVQASTIVSVISDLSAGGDKAKMTWLAICGAEFPVVEAKVIDVQKTDNNVDFMAYTGATPEDVQAATTPNMDVKVWTTPPPAGATPAATSAGSAAAQVTPQPDVVRLQKDDELRFAGTLVGYDPSPFLLHWDQVKVDPAVIPEKSEGGKRPPRKAPAK